MSDVVLYMMMEKSKIEGTSSGKSTKVSKLLIPRRPLLPNSGNMSILYVADEHRSNRFLLIELLCCITDG